MGPYYALRMGWRTRHRHCHTHPHARADLSLEASNLPRHWDISASALPSSRSLLLDVDAGRPLLHWVELDHSFDRNATDYPRPTLLWSAGRLADATRYIVAFRDLMYDNGTRIASSPGFAALRDKTPSSSPDIEASRRELGSLA